MTLNARTQKSSKEKVLLLVRKRTRQVRCHEQGDGRNLVGPEREKRGSERHYI
jgi:hypothetical protein